MLYIISIFKYVYKKKVRKVNKGTLNSKVENQMGPWQPRDVTKLNDLAQGNIQTIFNLDFEYKLNR